MTELELGSKHQYLTEDMDICNYNNNNNNDVFTVKTLKIFN